MKKLIILTLITAITITAASCKSNDVVTEEILSTTSKPIQTEAEEVENKSETLNEGPMKLAFQGKIDNLQAGIGSMLPEVIGELGEPSILDNFEGASYISYENMNFMLDRIIESTNEEAAVTGIIAAKGYKLYGVNVGMTMEEIKKNLGAAQQEYKADEDEGGMWKMEYNCGDYKLTFFFDDKNSPSSSAYLSKFENE